MFKVVTYVEHADRYNLAIMRKCIYILQRKLMKNFSQPLIQL
jgi:hypothetical protein